MGTAAPAQQQVNRTRSATQRAGRMVDLDLHPQEWGVNTHGLAHGWSGAVGSVVPTCFRTQLHTMATKIQIRDCNVCTSSKVIKGSNYEGRQVWC